MDGPTSTSPHPPPRSGAEPQPPATDPIPRPVSYAMWAIIWGVCPILLANSLDTPWRWGVLVAVPVLGLMILLRRKFMARRVLRSVRYCATLTCKRCGYDLATVHHPPAELGASMAVTTCPECGTPYGRLGSEESRDVPA